MKPFLIQLQTVATSEGGNMYARDILGRTYFPQQKDMELTKGMWCVAIQSVQTKTRNVTTGDLEDLATPREILQITATFESKEDARAAMVEVATAGLEVASEIAAKGRELKLDDAAVAQLASAW